MRQALIAAMLVCMPFAARADAACHQGTDGCSQSGCPQGYECARPPGGCEHDRQCLPLRADERGHYVKVEGVEDAKRCEGGADTCSKQGCLPGWQCIRPPRGCAHDTVCVLVRSGKR